MILATELAVDHEPIDQGQLSGFGRHGVLMLAPSALEEGPPAMVTNLPPSWTSSAFDRDGCRRATCLRCRSRGLGP